MTTPQDSSPAAVTVSYVGVVIHDMRRRGPGRARDLYIRRARDYGRACRNSLVLASSTTPEISADSAECARIWARLATREAVRALLAQSSGRCQHTHPYIPFGAPERWRAAAAEVTP